MAYTYTSFQTALALEMIVPNALSTAPNAGINDPNFQAILPTIVDQAEQRCYRELNLLYAVAEQWFVMIPYQRTQSFAAAGAIDQATGNPIIGAPQIIIPSRVGVGSPSVIAEPSPPTFGPQPLYPVTMDYIDAIYSNVYPSWEPTGLPEVFALHDDMDIAFGPTPDQAYTLQVVGQTRPIALYKVPFTTVAGDQTTFLTSVLPDLFLAASMVAASAYRHNFGAQSDDPRMAVSWESQYQTLLASAKTEEIRKRFLGWGMMSSQSPPPPPAPPGA